MYVKCVCVCAYMPTLTLKPLKEQKHHVGVISMPTSWSCFRIRPLCVANHLAGFHWGVRSMQMPGPNRFPYKWNMHPTKGGTYYLHGPMAIFQVCACLGLCLPARQGFVAII